MNRSAAVVLFFALVSASCSKDERRRVVDDEDEARPRAEASVPSSSAASPDVGGTKTLEELLLAYSASTGRRIRISRPAFAAIKCVKAPAPKDGVVTEDLVTQAIERTGLTLRKMRTFWHILGKAPHDPSCDPGPPRSYSIDDGQIAVG